MKIALVGNPNCGKTTLFNSLTGSNQYVGNWPGVTVEQKTGQLKYHGDTFEIVDLPGIYSMSTFSLEEVISRDYIEKSNPNVIINIVDASNIERNLFLTLQLLEMECPVVIALNMMDIIDARGDILNWQLLEQKLGVPIVPIVASKSKGIDSLIEKTIRQRGQSIKRPIVYSSRVQSLIEELEKKMNLKSYRRMYAVRFIDEGVSAISQDDIKFNPTELNNLVEKRIWSVNTDRDMIIADEKYKFISQVVGDCLQKRNIVRFTVSDRIDSVVTNRILAIPLFLFMMLMVFFIAFGPLGNNAKALFEDAVSYTANSVNNMLNFYSVAPWLCDLVVNGIIRGVGSVLSILPQIAILFLMLSFLEDSGYMARAAFIMDRPLRKFGLSGRSFIPMLMGFGCTVPALLSTRILDNERDRRMTMIITPFISCGARYPVYALIAGVFFTKNQMIVVYSMYIIGIIVALISGYILNILISKKHSSSFIMELPEYRMPTVKNLTLHTFDKINDFVTKAGTVLVVAFVVIWFLEYFDFSFEKASGSNSILGTIGEFLAPIFTPLGFGNWQASSSLLSGIVAKEAIAGTLGIVSTNIASLFTSASAYSFMIFTLLYVPCIAAMTTLKKEMNSIKWTLFAAFYQLVTAWIVSFIVYNICLIAL